jgi:hypothetical protein
MRVHHTQRMKPNSHSHFLFPLPIPISQLPRQPSPSHSPLAHSCQNNPFVQSSTRPHPGATHFHLSSPPRPTRANINQDVAPSASSWRLIASLCVSNVFFPFVRSFVFPLPPLPCVRFPLLPCWEGDDESACAFPIRMPFARPGPCVFRVEWWGLRRPLYGGTSIKKKRFLWTRTGRRAC